MKSLSELLGYPQTPVEHPPATRTHKCGIYKEDYKYVPSDGANRRSAPCTSTVDHTGMTATQRKIMAVLQRATEPVDAKYVCLKIKQGHGSASINLTKLYKMKKVSRELINNGKTRWYVYVAKP